MRSISLVAFLFLFFLSGCSGSGNSFSTITPTVSAQTTYSNASLSGTYSMSWFYFASGTGGLNSFSYSGVGTIKLDGNGNVTTGSITLNNSSTSFPCTYTVTGTYSLQSTALGAATLQLSSGSGSCPSTDTWHLNLAAGNSGESFQMGRSDANIGSGSAVKQ